MAVAEVYPDRGQAMERRGQAMLIISRYVVFSTGAGFIPMPLVDIGAVTAVQLRMISKLASFYGVPFNRSRGKAVVSALLGGVIPSSLARGTLGGLVWGIPLVGPIVGMVTTPLFDGASTYAVGKVFIEHFESGGTFLDIDVKAFKAAYEEKKAEAQDTLAGGAGRASDTGTSKHKPASAT